MLGKVLKSGEAMVKAHGYEVAKMVVKDPMFLCVFDFTTIDSTFKFDKMIVNT